MTDILKTNLTCRERKEGFNEVCWQSPSNIALIKYWGKHGNQLPSNPSLSFSLSKSVSQTSIQYQYFKEQNDISVEFYLDGESIPKFSSRIEKYLASLINDLPIIKNLHLIINSSNTFPHSSGIASSASGMSALALCLCSIENYICRLEKSTDDFYRRASYLSRLASGSASRSVYGNFALWGDNQVITTASNFFAIPLQTIVHPIFKNLKDAILIISRAEKEVSSSIGHSLMVGHPFAEQRFIQANKNLNSLINILQIGDFKEFADIVENEALSLHSMMMTSTPSIILMQAETLNIINKIRKFREQTGRLICFTLDAGPNIHILYPKEEQKYIHDFINQELLVYCEDKLWIDDEIGSGPVMIMNKL